MRLRMIAAIALIALAASASAQQTITTPSAPPIISGLRLSNLTATPVLSATTSAATSHFCTPYTSQWVPIFNGSSLSMMDTGGELTQTAADNTKSPAAVANSSVYDVFVWNDAGTMRCTRGPAWTNDTTRGYTLTRQNGVLLNTSTITNGPAALRGTLIGTMRSNGTATFDYIFGANGTAAFFGVWNLYNRVDVMTNVSDSTASWTITVNTTRQVNASAVNQVTFVSGLAEDAPDATYTCHGSTAAINGAFFTCGVKLDATNGMDRRSFGSTPAASVEVFSASVRNAYAPQLGVHFIAAVEAGDNANQTTFIGGIDHGLNVKLRM